MLNTIAGIQKTLRDFLEGWRDAPFPSAAPQSRRTILKYPGFPSCQAERRFYANWFVRTSHLTRRLFGAMLRIELLPFANGALAP
jgi:hypothetical protein